MVFLRFGEKGMNLFFLLLFLALLRYVAASLCLLFCYAVTGGKEIQSDRVY